MPSGDTGEAESTSSSRMVLAGASGKYRIFATLGRGGMADVFLAAAQGPGGFTKLVVLKKLREARGEDPSFVTMFLDEARLSARLNHPNVVHTYEVGEDGDDYFIAMEYLEGQPLHRIARAMAERGRRLDPAMAAHILAEALRGLDHAHEMKDYDGSHLGIVHRDVSPQNLHVAYDGQVRVLDFGIAKAALNTSHTQAGVLKGKFAYMSPEQTTGADVDRRSDVFAAGIILWEVLAGERLFKGDNAVAIAQLAKANMEPPSSRCPAVPPELDAIVMRALRRDPAERFATAQEMASALEDFLHGTGARVRREDIARTLNELFGGAQEEMQRQIKGHMAALASSPSFSSLPALRSGSHPSLSFPQSALASSSGVMACPPALADEVLESVDVAMPTMFRSSDGRRGGARRRRAAAYVLAGTAAAVAAAAVAVAVVGRRAPSGSAAADEVARAQVSPSSSSTALSPDPRESLHLTLSSEPLEAQVEWEGKVVGHTPMLIDLLPGPQSFVLSRDGYFNSSIVLNVNDAMMGRAQSRTVVLVARPGEPNAAGARPPATDPRARRAPAKSAVPSVQEEHPASAPSQPEPPPAPSAPPPAFEAVVAPSTGPASPPPTSAPVVSSVLPFGPDMSRPVLLSGNEPVYTREAMVAQVEGTVIARCTITVAGTLEGCRILKGLPYMDRSMLDALATRRYSPVLYQGRPVAVQYVFNVKLVAPR